MRVLLLFALNFCCICLSAQPGPTWEELNAKTLDDYKKGAYHESVRMADLALAAAEQERGLLSEQYITSLENKSHALSAIGNYLQSVKLSRKAAQLSFSLYTKPHLMQIETLHGLAKTQLDLGQYDSSEYSLKQAHLVFVLLPKDNKVHYDSAIWHISDLWVKVNALEATLYHRKGQIDKAIEIMEEQLRWLQDIYPDSYEKLDDYQTTLNNLGTYYNEIGQLEKSKIYALQYLSLLTKYDDKPIDKINAWQNLGSLYRSLENYDSALYYLNTAISEIEQDGLEKSKLYVILLNNLGTLYLDLDQTGLAVSLLNKSKELQDNKGALDSRVYKNTLYNLAEAFRWSGEYQEADSLYSELIKLIIDDVDHNFTYLSDVEKLSFYKSQLQFINDYKSFSLEISGLLNLQDSDDPYINPAVAGNLYNLQLSTKAIILNATKRMRNTILNGGDTSLIAAYVHWELAKNQLANQINNQLANPQSIDSLESTVELYEKWLINHSANFRKGFQREEISWRDVQRKLKEGEAAVELIRLVDGLAYAAVIVTPQTVEQPVISLIIGKNRKFLEDEFYANYRNSIAYQQKDTVSYGVFWKPIFQALKTNLGEAPREIYLSNDGIYNQINLNTLYNPATGNYVLDETNIHLITNTKELLTTRNEVDQNKTVMLFGNPEFTSHAEKGYSFTPLPGAADEVKSINDIMKSAEWQTETFIGAEASEHKINNINQPGILHIASHGYFKPNNELTNSNINQMLNSGIVLSANGEFEDGLLTAYEVMTHDYDATQLVVLSACETGLGTLNYGEGVYGLQRALRVAGTSNIIMSLWKVDDEATKLLMTQFYKYLTQGNDIRAAFVKAQQNIRDIYPDPYYWGAFILAGT